MTEMDKWIHDVVRPKHEGIVGVDFVKAYGNIVLKEVRHGNFIHFEQAMSLLDDESEAIQLATLRSLKWAYRAAHEVGNQEVMDRILPFLVLEAL